jgi:hypothetical protein
MEITMPKGQFALVDVPLSVLNRALDLFSVEREKTTRDAWDALQSAESRKDVTPDFPGISPLAQAVAEYMSLSGPWNEEDGEYAGENGYTVDTR